MYPLLRQLSLTLLVALSAASAFASQAGLRQISLPGLAPATAAVPVALYYPTQAPESSIAMGPFMVRVAMRSPPEASVKGLIVLSHGTGGSELGHTSLAEALARHGYLVAALRQPGDNWQDRSLLRNQPERYFTDRPQQVSHVISELLRDPEWRDRIAKDANGPHVGALGHSAGGYTVLALAGGQPNMSRLESHCREQQANDAVFCSLGRVRPATSATETSGTIPSLTDARVRAIVAMAPLGVVLTAQSLAGIKIPVAIYSADKDRFLVPRFHAEWIAQNLPTAKHSRVANAWHFVFMDPPTMVIPTEDGDIAADPTGFDRKQLLGRLQREIPAFFDAAFR